MKGTPRYLSLLGVAAAFGATMIAPASAPAAALAGQSNKTVLVATPSASDQHATVQWYHHRTRVRHRHHRYSHAYYYRTNTAAQGFPNYYPNIQYFRQNGHIYYRNLDTGEVFLSQW